MTSAQVSELGDDLNPSHKLHLLTHFQYVDKLFSEIEAVLSAANSKSPFPRFKGDITPTQIKVIQDYLARYRAQIVHLLASQGIQPPPPDLGSIHTIRVTLAFAEVAFEECTPGRMRGYGKVPESKVEDLNGMVAEMTASIKKLDQYLAQGLGQDLEARLQRLERAGDEIHLLKELERIINRYGLVEFRPSLEMILDRLESNACEIAMFGRVSSGKSSLLNHIVQSDVLPVGVNPITAVPTRLAYGPEPKLSVWFAHKSPEQMDVSRLPEYVTESLNPSNSRRVTRITVKLPSQRLHDGVVLVDTPGLGSLATAGAAETLAYLPRCDLGVVLIDAGSTLTQDDLGTIHALYEAGVPASVLLSKADLLAPGDRAQSANYIAGHIRTQLGVDLPVHPVSVKEEHSDLLNLWVEHEITPLFQRHQQLAQESIRRKIGALRESVETALKMRLGHSTETVRRGGSSLRDAESRLRVAAARFEDARKQCWKVTDQIRNLVDSALERAAWALLDAWRNDGSGQVDAGRTVADAATQVAAQEARSVYATLEALARDLAQALQAAAQVLNREDAPREEELIDAFKEMPRIELPALTVDVKSSLFTRAWNGLAKWQIQKSVRAQAESEVADSFSSYGRMLEAWTRRMVAELQRRFDMHADAYRAQLHGAAGGSALTPSDQDAIQHDLESIAPQSKAQLA